MNILAEFNFKRIQIQETGGGHSAERENEALFSTQFAYTLRPVIASQVSSVYRSVSLVSLCAATSICCTVHLIDKSLCVRTLSELQQKTKNC